MAGKKRLDPNSVDVDSLEVEELERAAGGVTDVNENCRTCTCPAQPAEPILIANADRAQLA